MDKQIKVGAVLTYGQIILNNILSFIYTPLTIYYLGKQQYGLFSFVNAIISYISIMDMGFSSAVIRFNSQYIAEKDEKKQAEVNGTFLIIYSVLAVLALVIGFIVYKNINLIWGNGFTENELVLIHKMLLVAVVSLAISFPLNVFNGIIVAYEKFIFSKLLNLVKTILIPVSGMVVLTQGAGALALVIISLIWSVVCGLINIFYCFAKLKIKISFKKFEYQTTMTIGRYSFYIFLSMMAGQLYANTDRLILGAVVGSAPLAVYNIAVQFNNYFQAFSNFGSGMFLPKLTKLVTNSDMDHLMKLLIKTSRIQLFICMYIYIGFICFGEKFIEFWVGPGFEEAYEYALILMFPYIFSIIQTLFATMLEAMNKHKIKSFIYLAVAIVNVVISLILVQPFGTLGCVIGTCIGMIINALANNIYYSQVLKINILHFWKLLLKPFEVTIFFGIVMYILFPFFEVYNLWSLIWNILIFTLIYIVFLWFLAFNKAEKDQIRKIIRRK